MYMYVFYHFYLVLYQPWTRSRTIQDQSGPVLSGLVLVLSKIDPKTNTNPNRTNPMGAPSQNGHQANIRNPEYEGVLLPPNRRGPHVQMNSCDKSFTHKSNRNSCTTRDAPFRRIGSSNRTCNGRIFYLFILSYCARLSYLITALVLSLFLIYGCGLVSS